MCSLNGRYIFGIAITDQPSPFCPLLLPTLCFISLPSSFLSYLLKPILEAVQPTFNLALSFLARPPQHCHQIFLQLAQTTILQASCQGPFHSFFPASAPGQLFAFCWHVVSLQTKKKKKIHLSFDEALRNESILRARVMLSLCSLLRLGGPIVGV